MKTDTGETEPPVVGMITGAFNPLFLGFQPTKFFYQTILRETNATDFFVTPFCGIGPPSLIYGVIRKEIDREFSKYPPERKKILVGHSMGGLMAANYMADHPDEVDTAVTIASVLGPIGVPILDGLISRNTREIEEKLEDLDGPRLHCIGSIYDEIIPTSSSLPDMAGDNRYEITTRANGTKNWLSDIAMLSLHFVSQHGLTVHHEEILDRASSLINL